MAAIHQPQVVDGSHPPATSGRWQPSTSHRWWGKQLFSFLVGAVFHFSSALVSISFSSWFQFLHLHFSSSNFSISLPPPFPISVSQIFHFSTRISALPFLHFSSVSRAPFIAPAPFSFSSSRTVGIVRAMACALTSNIIRRRWAHPGPSSCVLSPDRAARDRPPAPPVPPKLGLRHTPSGLVCVTQGEGGPKCLVFPTNRPAFGHCGARGWETGEINGDRRNGKRRRRNGRCHRKEMRNGKCHRKEMGGWIGREMEMDQQKK